MGGRRSQTKIAVDFVEHAHVEGAKLGGGDGGEEGSGGVARPDVVGGESGLVAGEVVGEVSPHEGPGSDADAGGGGELGHVEDVERSGGDGVTGRVFDSEVGALVGLEGHFAPLARDEGGFEDGGAVGLVLDLVEVEAGVAELAADFGGEGSGGGAVGLDGDGHGAGFGLAF